MTRPPEHQQTRERQEAKISRGSAEEEEEEERWFDSDVAGRAR
jgi:hypothetical protein